MKNIKKNIGENPGRPALTTSDPLEIAKFQDLAATWWDAGGPMAPLHRMNPVRLDFILARIRAHYGTVKNIAVLDVGCGGGLVCEPLARLGARVAGIDGAGDLITVAQHHAVQENLAIDYRVALTGDLLREKKRFDVVLALEVIEHVADADLFVAEIAQLVKPGGLVIFSTLNRTAKSLAFGVAAAEYLLRWLPAGTHDWRKFVKPSELHALCTAYGLNPDAVCGLTYNPLTRDFALNERDVKINYLLSAHRG